MGERRGRGGEGGGLKVSLVLKKSSNMFLPYEVVYFKLIKII